MLPTPRRAASRRSASSQGVPLHAEHGRKAPRALVGGIGIVARRCPSRTEARQLGPAWTRSTRWPMLNSLFAQARPGELGRKLSPKCFPALGSCLRPRCRLHIHVGFPVTPTEASPRRLSPSMSASPSYPGTCRIHLSFVAQQLGMHLNRALVAVPRRLLLGAHRRAPGGRDGSKSCRDRPLDRRCGSSTGSQSDSAGRASSW